MKKKLEAELISIAHRILKLKNKSEIDQLHQEAQKLYETLSILKFVEENFAEAKPTIGKTEVESKIASAFEAEAAPAEPVEPKAGKSKADAKPKNTAADTDPKTVQPEKPEENDEDKKPDETPDDQPEKPEVEEPETPAEEKLAENDEPVEAVETPLEKEVDQVIAETESELGEGEHVERFSLEGKPAESESSEKPVLDQSLTYEEPEAREEVAAAIADTTEVKQDDLFKPTFEWGFEAKAEENTPPAETKSGEIVFEDLLGKGYVDPVFVKPEEAQKDTVSYTSDELRTSGATDPTEPKPEVIPISRIADKIPVFKMNNDIADKSISLNDRLSKGITVGLNDRIAFVKNLFNNSNEDYNRVLSQLITFDTFHDAQDFIENMVKPDYNNWEGKDEYEQRFMEVVEKKFL